MCRSIKVLRGQAPTGEDVNKAALQFVRKVSGYSKPSKANQAAFERAIAEVAAATEKLLSLVEKSEKPAPSKDTIPSTATPAAGD